MSAGMKKTDFGSPKSVFAFSGSSRTTFKNEEQEMSFDKNFTVLGGDLRQAALASYLASKQYEVVTWGLPAQTLSPTVTPLDTWENAVLGAGVLILPLPASPDSKHLNLPLMQEEGKKTPRIFEILEKTPKNALVAGGRLSPKIREELMRQGLSFFDYFESETLQQKNAVPTAEGAIEVLMREVKRTVRDLTVAVTGFGRVSRALTALLLAMGARVTVMARKQADITEASALGCAGFLLEGERALSSLGGQFAVIFNTVPYCLFDEAVLRSLSRDTLIIDLASAPGGVDANAANALGIRTIWALSLPGKYAPITAGEIIAETVLSYLSTRKEGGL